MLAPLTLTDAYLAGYHDGYHGEAYDDTLWIDADHQEAYADGYAVGDCDR